MAIRKDVKPQSSGRADFERLRHDFSPGTIIAEAFEVHEFVDAGGMGYLFKGRHLRLKRDIAIKVLKKSKFSSEKHALEFLAEGQQLAQIHHQHVVRIYDVGTHKGHYFLVMDFIEGSNIFHIVQNKGGIYVDTAVGLMIKVTLALALVHKKDIIHRDITPKNIMVDTEGNPVLLDFGIAKSSTDETMPMESPGNKRFVTGAPGFISPERYNGHRHTPAADVFSLGQTFCYALTGAVPRNCDELQRILPERLRCSKSKALQIGALIKAMTEPDPKNRLKDGGEVLRELRRLNQKFISKRTMIGIAALFFLIGVLGFTFFSMDKQPDFGPRPRVIAVMPLDSADHPFSYLSFELEKELRRKYPNFTIVDRKNIEKTIEELQLTGAGLVTPDNSARIGRMVGAHFFVIFETEKENKQMVIYPKIYDVETTAIMGSEKLDYPTLNDDSNRNKELAKIADLLITSIDKELPYQSIIEKIQNKKVRLQHGPLFGARSGMRLRVLAKNNEDAVGLLEISNTSKKGTIAKVINGGDGIKKGMRVEVVVE